MAGLLRATSPNANDISPRLDSEIESVLADFRGSAAQTVRHTISSPAQRVSRKLSHD